MARIPGHIRHQPHPVLRTFSWIVVIAAAIACLVLVDRYCEKVDRLANRAFSSPLKPLRRLTAYIVKPGDTFAGILGRFGVSKVSAETCYRSLSPLGLFSLFPGDSVVLGISRSGEVDTLALLNRLQYRYHLTNSDGDIRAVRRPIAISTYQCLVKGELARSLSEDMGDLGTGDALVSKFAEIFAWDINFFTDLKKGDRFEVIFEKKFAEGRFFGYGEILAAYYITPSKTFAAIGFRDADNRMQYYDMAGKSVQKQFLKAPLKFSRVSSGFTLHRLDPILGIVRPHQGIDYAAPSGTPVYAPADGIITYAGIKGGYGNYVGIKHGAGYQTFYGHLSAYAPGTRAGRKVSQGDLIGRVGSTGWSTGPHLDYRMTINGSFVNSQTVKLPSKKGIEASEQAAFDDALTADRMIFSTRFVGARGCWVLSIDSDRPIPSYAAPAVAVPAHHDNTSGT